MRAITEWWELGLAASVMVTVGLLGVGINLGGDLHGFVAAVLHLFGAPL